MREFLFITAILISLSSMSLAQKANVSNRLGLGFQLNQYQEDFGMGLNMTSPYFIHEKVALRLRANLMYHEHTKEAETTWTPYSNVSLGLIGGSGFVADFIRLYGEGGLLTLLPSEEFSSGDPVFGGYGLFGFEFYMAPKANYFIELGGVGTGAVADKLANNPIYSNGLTISAGFRMHL